MYHFKNVPWCNQSSSTIFIELLNVSYERVLMIENKRAMSINKANDSYVHIFLCFLCVCCQGFWENCCPYTLDTLVVIKRRCFTLIESSNMDYFGSSLAKMLTVDSVPYTRITLGVYYRRCLVLTVSFTQGLSPWTVHEKSCHQLN